jgi:uncharacterized protein
MDRVFLDANVLFSAAYMDESEFRLLWELEGVELWTSTYAADEALRSLGEKRPQRLAELRRLLSRIHVHASTGSERALPPGLPLEEKDRPVLAAAIEIRATHLLTGDKAHFGRYYGRLAGGVRILTPAEYLRRRE